MCIGDWRLGRLIALNQTVIPTGGLQTVAIPANMQRVGISFFVSSTPTITVIGANISIDGVLAMDLNQNEPYVHFNTYFHGRLPTRAFSITTIGGATSGLIIEYILPEDVIQAGLDQIKSDYRL